MPTEEYFRPSISRGQKESIEDLFRKYDNVKKFYGGSKGKFIEDAIRRLVVFYDRLYEKRKPD